MPTIYWVNFVLLNLQIVSHSWINPDTFTYLLKHTVIRKEQIIARLLLLIHDRIWTHLGKRVIFILILKSHQKMTDINECASSPCVQGTCVDEIARYRCVCEVLFIGVNCERCEFQLMSSSIFIFFYVIERFLKKTSDFFLSLNSLL